MYKSIACLFAFISLCTTSNARSKPACTQARKPRTHYHDVRRYARANNILVGYSFNNVLRDYLCRPLLSSNDPRAQVYPAHDTDSDTTIIMYPNTQAPEYNTTHQRRRTGAWRTLFTQDL